MRHLALACAVILAVLVASSAPSTAADSKSSIVIQFWYTWGTNVVGAAQVWTYGGTNLTMNATLSGAGGVQTEEITEFHVHAVAPGKDAYPAANGTNPFLFPQVTAFYDTSQVIRDPNQCVPANNSVGFVCDAPQVNWQHQVIEIRFLRLFEFSDVDGDGGYDTGEPVISQMSLSDRSLHYGMPQLYGLNDTMGLLDLPVRSNSSAVYGDSTAGWVGQSETAFQWFDGLGFTISATGPLNLTITGYQWFTSRSFQGTNVAPTNVKMDLGIGSYPFQTTNSRLAMELKVTSFSQGSSTNWGVVPWPDGKALGIDASNTSAVFAWSFTAIADGVSSTVVDTVVPVDALSQSVYLSYPRASLIRHDPVLGITDKRLGGGQLVLPPPLSSFGPAWLGFGVTLAATAVVIFAIERRKR